MFKPVINLGDWAGSADEEGAGPLVPDPQEHQEETRSRPRLVGLLGRH